MGNQSNVPQILAFHESPDIGILNSGMKEFPQYLNASSAQLAIKGFIHFLQADTTHGFSTVL